MDIVQMVFILSVPGLLVAELLFVDQLSSRGFWYAKIIGFTLALGFYLGLMFLPIPL